jgi:tyrosine-protein kinase Etk/Wzc
MNNYVYFILDNIARYKKSFFYIVVGGFLFLCLFLFLTPKQYLAETKIQLLDSDSSSSMLTSQISEIAGGLGSLIGVNATSAVGAEITIYRSREVLSNVINENLDNITFVNKNLFKRFFSRTRVVDKSFKMQAEINKIIHPKSLIQDLEFMILKTDQQTYDIFFNNELVFQNAYLNEDISLEKYGVILNIGKILGQVNDRFILTIQDYQYHVDYLKENVSINSINEGLYPTGIFSVRFSGVDKDDIVETLQLMNKFYINQNIERVNREISKVIEFIDLQMPILNTNLLKSQDQLSSFQKDNNSIDLTLEMQSKIQELVAIDEVIYMLNSELAKAELTYGNKSKSVMAIQSQIKESNSARKLLSLQINSLPDIQKEYVNLLRNVELNNLLVTTFITKKAELELVRSGALGNARVLDSPFLYPNHIFPNMFQSILAYLLLAMTSFGFVIFYHQSIKGSINSPSSLIETLDNNEISTNIIGIMPKIESLNDKQSSNILELYNDNSLIDLKEIMDGFRQNIIFDKKEDSNPYQIAVIGGNPEIGKSFFSSLTALSLSEVGKTLLVDFDLKKGVLHKTFDLKNNNGILDNLHNNSSLQPQSVSNNLDILTRGQIRKNQNIKIANRFNQFNDLFEETRSKYDFIVFDTPPILITNDLLPFLHYFDKKLIVINESISTKNHTLAAYEKLDKLGQSIDGILYNFHEDKTKIGYYDYSYRYGYGGSYNYSYSYYNYKYGADNENNE